MKLEWVPTLLSNQKASVHSWNMVIKVKLSQGCLIWFWPFKKKANPVFDS
jgi:hypothetical protein